MEVAMQRRNFIRTGAAALAVAGLSFAVCTATTSYAATSESNAAKRRSIDAKVQGTMSRLYANVKGSRELVAKANGVLVFPSVIQAGFVVGGQYGEGALRVGGKSVGYYSTVSGSFGLQAGGQSKAIIFLFMTRDALNRFRRSDGWAARGRRIGRTCEGRSERGD
jgi:lipid-binding SYLF domain-containing protein